MIPMVIPQICRKDPCCKTDKLAIILIIENNALIVFQATGP